MDALLADIRFALRAMVRRPAFAVAAVLSLGLGLAATSAVFSVLNAALFKPVPGVTRPERLVEVARSVGGETADVSWEVYDRLRGERDVVENLAALALTTVSILGDGEPVMRGALAVTGNYFDLLGVRTELGRTFAPDEASWPLVKPVAVITHAAWQRELNGDSSVIGKVVRMNGVPVEIVGVLREGFTGHHTALLQDVFLPLGLDVPGLPRPASLAQPNASSLEMLGRLTRDVSPDLAARALSAAADRMVPEAAASARSPSYVVSVERWGPLPGLVRRSVATFLTVLLALVALALGMACVNVTTIVLARALDRQRELAVRRAIGATRGRLVRQVVTEVSVLFAIAGAVGMLLSWWGTGLLVTFAPPVPIPGRLGVDLTPDGRVFLFALVVTFGAALAFSLLPALHASRFQIVAALREGGSSDTRARSRLRSALVGAQTALTTVLVVATALFGRAIQSIHAAQPEWNLDGVLVSSMDLELNGTTNEAGIAFQHDVRRRIVAIPGVTAVAFAAKLPVGGRSSFGYTYRVGDDAAPGTGVDASLNRVTPDYFSAMGIPLRRGRDFSEADGPTAARVAIVNETMARRMWGEADPIGERFYVWPGESRQEFEVVGVAGSSRFAMPGRPAEVQYYLPQAQWYTSAAVVHVRAAPGFALSVAGLAREAIREAMPTLPVGTLRPITDALDVQLLPQRIATWVAATMGLFGLILAAVGVYGVTAVAVSRRGREIAIRMALGATAGDVARLVLRQGARAPVIGIGAGLAAGAALAFAIGRLGVIPGVQPADPLVLLAAPVLLGLVALAAMFDPVRRAVTRPAMSALRED